LQAQAISTDLALIKALGGGYRSDIDNKTAQSTAAPSPTSHSAGAP
jgi:hypothetical protein